MELHRILNFGGRLLPFALASALSFSSCSILTGVQADPEYVAAAGLTAIQGLTISDAQVQSEVHQYITELDAKSKVLGPSSPYTKRLNRLVGNLPTVDGLTLNFKVYQTDEANAFACADGSVRVYSKLMDLMSDDELIGVLGHEIGHVALKHTKKQFKAAYLATAARYGLISAGGAVGELSASALGDLSQSLANASFSRKEESEADDYGYNFLKKTGKNTWAMAMAFERLRDLEGGGQSDLVNQLFSSHPDLEKRIVRMSERAAKDGYKRPAGK